MAYAEDLLEQAGHLVRRDRKRPKQASLRRAISTAYYALFHLLVADGVRNWKQTDQRNTFARAFDHRVMKEASNRMMRSVPGGTAYASLRWLANSFVELQQARHLADYDNSKRWSREEAEGMVQLAQTAFETWVEVRQTAEAQRYLLSLFLRRRVE